jgi:hypothetical protein
LRTVGLATLCALAFFAAPAAAQMPGGAPQEPPGALHRYYNANTNTHWVTPTPVAGDFQYEFTLGFLHTTPGAGRSPIYGCRSGSADYFLSHDPGCEGTARLGVYGWVDDARTSGSAALYRCVVPGIGHFASQDAGCEGQVSEGRLGYIPQRQDALARYNGGKHWVTSGRVGAGWGLESVLGFLLQDAGPGRRALYECLAGDDRFLSLDPGCEGRGELGLSGYLYATDPGTEPVVPLYRCVTASDHFASPDPGCEGQKTEALLGYLRRNQELIQRAYNPSANTHWVSTGALPPGWFFEFTLGYALTREGGDRAPFFSCLAGSADAFVSLASNCEGQRVLGRDGFLYTAAGPDTTALYRCNTGVDHFVSADAACEGHKVEARLGYARASSPEPPPPPPVPPQLTCTSTTVTVSAALRGRKVRRVRYGGSSTVGGRVRNADGSPVAGGAVSILIGDRKPLALGEVTTDGKGRYSFRVRPGKNRLIHAGYRAPGAAQLSCSRIVRLNVRAGLTLKARPKRVRAGHSVRFRGRLLGHPIPKVGKLIDLQAFDGGRWRTFDTVRANRKGRYHARYRFRHTFRSRTFRFRARARREARYPYALGTSKVVRVRVRA